MSLRPSIYAADIGRFRISIAGDRAPLAQLVERWLREHGLETTVAGVDRDLDQLLAGAWAGKSERDEQVVLVAALAHACGVDTESAMIHWGDWKIGAYEDYFDAVKSLLPPASVKCFEIVRSGRPLFGNGMETEWSYYSYLTADEVRSLSGGACAVTGAGRGRLHPRLPDRVPRLDDADRRARRRSLALRRMRAAQLHHVCGGDSGSRQSQARRRIAAAASRISRNDGPVYRARSDDKSQSWRFPVRDGHCRGVIHGLGAADAG